MKNNSNKSIENKKINVLNNKFKYAITFGEILIIGIIGWIGIRKFRK